MFQANFYARRLATNNIPAEWGDPCHLRDHEYRNFARRYPRLVAHKTAKRYPKYGVCKLGAVTSPETGLKISPK